VIELSDEERKRFADYCEQWANAYYTAASQCGDEWIQNSLRRSAVRYMAVANDLTCDSAEAAALK